MKTSYNIINRNEKVFGIFETSKEIIGKTMIHIVLIFLTIAAFFPFFIMLGTSLKEQGSLLEFPIRLIPKPVHWRSYFEIFQKAPVKSAILNSIKVSTLVIAGSLFTSSIAGFAFAKLNFRGKKVVFGILLASMMFPSMLTLMPAFVIYDKFRWIDTLLPLIVPGVLSSAFNVFMMRQFFKTIPNALMESGKIDGAGFFYIYIRIMLPLCLPAMATIGLFTFRGVWNDFVTPMFFLNSESKFTIPLMVNYFKNQYYTYWNLTMAVSTISMLPVVVVFLFSQKALIDGLMIGGVKG